MLPQGFVYIGIIISILGSLGYLIDTIKGKIKPNKVSFALWSIVSVIAFFAEIKQGVGIQSLMTLSVGLLPFFIFLGSFVNKKAYWKISTFDLGCGALSLVGLLLWYMTKVGNWAIVFSILADGFACIPTLTKAYKFPETESAWPWLADSANGLFTLLTLKVWSFAYTGFPVYILVINIILFMFIQLRVGKQSPK